MKPNLAAAVDILRKFQKGDVLTTTALNCIETILAELGRGAGEPVAELVEAPDKYSGLGIVFHAAFNKLPAGTKLYARPPVAGLAELTDEQWFKLGRELSCCSPRNRAKVAREFLGKVDGNK
tara:strand:- start:97 stop:462 length:366 start_codon:yes stop_codon:yes gene_type:complete